MTRQLSASRLNAFQACRHQTTLWLEGVKPPEREGDSVDLVRRKGFEHEDVVLKRLEAAAGAAVEIPSKDLPMAERVAMTVAAMRDGAPLIYQGALVADGWVGLPDFLVRVGQGEDGIWLYEPEDAKLAKRAKAEHLLQLGIYGLLIEETTGHFPETGTIHGSGPASESFKLADTRHITRRMMSEFERFIAEPEPTRPVKTAACGHCDFFDRCESEWRAADSPIFVAGLTGAQVIKLERAGVHTLSQLAELTLMSVPGMGDDTLAKLIAQAKLQKRGRAEGKGLVELLQPSPLRGFELLPHPQTGDLFYDIEGDPLYPEGLEYLHGLWGPLGDGPDDVFVPIWAHDHAEEKLAFEQLMDRFARHFERYPVARIYHYANYEQAALKRLAMRYATREAQLDAMLREGRFVDLFAVARHAIRTSTESYSLKDLEKIYWGERAGEVTNAGDSIVEYERWRELGEQKILHEIQLYNEQDCVSTKLLREWLVGLRPSGAGLALVSEADDAKSQAKAAEREQIEAQRQSLAARVRKQTQLEPDIRELIAELLWFHQRSQKPQWWALFDRQTWTDEELLEDPESLGQLTLDDMDEAVRSNVATYNFPPQDTKLRVGDRPRFALTLEPAGEIAELDLDAGVVTLKRTKNAGDFPEEGSLSPGQLIQQGPLERAVVEVAARLAAGDFETDRALLDMLRRRAPRMVGRSPGSAIVGPGEDLVSAAKRAVSELDRSTLIIQGPPGTGKTFTTARAIVKLLQDGKRVGVSSNSHKAINNVLEAVSAYAESQGVELHGVKKSGKDADTAFLGYGIVSVGSSEDIKPHHNLVGATAFEFAKHEPDSFDALFVDEAGQVSLGNLVAMSGCAKSLILVGDQMQLPQPVQGVHPGESGLSSMDYAMQDHATVPPDRGILLNVSWRMHPAVCEFISDALYDGRLTAHETTGRQGLHVPAGRHAALKSAGISFVSIDHEGCTQSSAEEADVIRDLIAQLFGTPWTNSEGDTTKIGLNDILVVAPFNMQVSLLKKTLPTGTRVGTVDKFQGQEAAVAIVSMATSFGGDAPRGTEFLFNRNRLNVAISRAKCLAIVVGGERLMSVPTPGLKDLPRLNLLAHAEAVGSAQIVTA